MIAKLYAKEIVNGSRTYKDCPAKLKEAVAKELIKLGREDLVLEQQ